MALTIYLYRSLTVVHSMQNKLVSTGRHYIYMLFNGEREETLQCYAVTCMVDDQHSTTHITQFLQWCHRFIALHLPIEKNVL